MGNLKGTAYQPEEYLFKKNHPIRWWIGKLFKKLASQVKK